MNKNNLFISLLIEVLNLAKKEEDKILNNKESHWNLEQIQNVVIPEISELLTHAKNGKIYFKYGKKQRLLESTHLMTDSVDNLFNTPLGESILNVQNIYRRGR